MSAQAPAIEALRLAASELDEAQQGRLTLKWADRVYDASEPIEFLIGDETNGLITKGSVNLLVGEGGSKKTWAALDLAVCVAMGARWLDFPTRQTSVLIVDEESGPRRLQRRLYETLQGHLVKREDAPPIAFTSLAQLDMRNPDDVTALSLAIRESNAGLVIVDALADIMPGADENSVKDVQPVFMQLRRVAETTRAALFVIHHSNKQNGTYRGSTAIKGAVDLMLMVESATDSRYVTFKADKARDIEPKSFTAIATWQREGEQFYLSATDVNPKAHLKKSARYVLRYLADHPSAPIDEIMNNADVCTGETARREVYNLVDSGHIERTNSGTGRGNKAQYDLTDKGRDALKGEE